MHNRLSPAVKAISHLPIGRSAALRVWNRVLWAAPKPRTVPTYFGARMICDPRDIIQSTITHFGVWEPEISQVMEQVAAEGDLVVDMGANIGYYSLLLSKLVGPSGTVVAIEAMPHLAKRVEEHAHMNGANNIRVVNAAAAAARGRLMMYQAPDTNSGASTSIAAKGYTEAGEVEALPLTDILTADECRRLTLLKCDIEGAEVPVMGHLLDNLDRFNERLSVQVETSPGAEWSGLFTRFIAAGYRAYQFPTEIAEAWTNLLAGRDGQGWKEVASLPDGVSDVLFTKAELRR
ncbi:MAG: FkbM family methyltransferase [Pseudomonadota bacterium]